MSKKVLIVEDDEDIQFYYRILLSELDLEIIRAAHGEEAIQRLDSDDDVALILLDIVLPVMGGEEFFRHLRCDKKSEIPVILTSVDEEMMARLKSIGPIQGIFMKGSGGEHLKNMICEILEI